MADTPVSPPSSVAPATAPNRSTATDPAVYSAVADTWAASLGAWNTYLTSLGTNVKFNADSAFDSASEAAADAVTAASAKDAAVAAANYVGEWSAQSGAATVPTSVSNNDILYGLKVDVADITAVEPGVTSGWETTWLRLSAQAVVSDYQEFLSSGTWTKPEGANFVLVELWSGGGGGPNTTASNTSLGGASGGEYVWAIFDAADLSAVESVTVGAGGAGGADGGDNNGSAGGSTTFGSLLTAIGGNPGTTSSNRAATVPRSSSSFYVATDKFYACTVFPQAGAGVNSALNEVAGTIYGGGGGGNSLVATVGLSEKGGNGGAGNNTLNTAAAAGDDPSGGGGASGNNGGGGNGGRGEARIWTW